jgi:hypothetical protein
MKTRNLIKILVGKQGQKFGWSKLAGAKIIILWVVDHKVSQYQPYPV